MFIFHGILINAATILTTGMFLSGYIVHLKGSDFLVGVLNNSPTWACIASIFSYLIYERMEKRKTFLIILSLISRVLSCSIVFLPLISKNDTFILTAVSIMTILGNVIWSFYGIGITVWMMGLLPKDTRNEYIYFRWFWLRISFTLTTITMGFVLDWFNKSYAGFLIAFSTSLILSIIDAVILTQADEPEYLVNKELKFSASLFFEPLKNKEYRVFLTFIFLFNLLLTMSSSFTSLYLIRYLELDYKFISTVNVISYVLMIACTGFWGRVEREKGLQFVLKVTAIIAITDFFIYHFIRSETTYLLLLASFIAGIGSSGYNIAIFTYRYDIIPERFKTMYEGWYGAVVGISVLIGPIIGNFLMSRIPEIHNSIYQYSKFQILYMISFVLAVLLILFMFYKPNEVDSKQESESA